MCIHIPTCLCHYMEIAIKEDHTKQFKQFFDNQCIDEIYHFLLDAYLLIETNSNSKFVIELNKLVQTYLLEYSSQSINVQNDRVKKEFLGLYDTEIDDLLSAKSSLQEKLILLIKDVQTLAYKNLAGDESFMQHFKNLVQKSSNNDPSNNDTEVQPPRRRKACVVC